jgi:hypothetical protein
MSFRALRDMDIAFEMWTIDVEFASVAKANAVPFAICIRDIKLDEIILFTNVDYSMRLTNIEQAFRKRGKTV